MSEKVVVYGTMECGDTVTARERLDREGVAYSYVDVLSSLGALREFMNIRDANPQVFAETVRNGGVGIPIAVVGESVFNDLENMDLTPIRKK